MLQTNVILFMSIIPELNKKEWTNIPILHLFLYYGLLWRWMLYEKSNDFIFTFKM